MAKFEHPKYSGELGEPIPYSLALSQALQTMAGVPAEYGRPFTTARERRYELLFDHYEIPRDDPYPLRWLKLAVALAEAHVPGLTVGEPGKERRPRGRPATAVSPKLRKLLGYEPAKRGKPKSYTDEELDLMLEWLPKFREALRQQGRAATTKAAALEVLKAIELHRNPDHSDLRRAAAATKRLKTFQNIITKSSRNSSNNPG